MECGAVHAGSAGEALLFLLVSLKTLGAVTHESPYIRPSTRSRRCWGCAAHLRQMWTLFASQRKSEIGFNASLATASWTFGAL